MSTDTEKNINEAIDWLQQAGGSVQDFAVEQAPLYCREVVAWELWYGIALVVFGVVMLATTPLFWKLTAKVFKTDKYGNPAALVPGFAGVMAAIAGCFVLSYGIPKAIKAAVAPRLVIVEHLRGLKP